MGGYLLDSFGLGLGPATGSSLHINEPSVDKLLGISGVIEKLFASQEELNYMELVMILKFIVCAYIVRRRRHNLFSQFFSTIEFNF